MFPMQRTHPQDCLFSQIIQISQTNDQANTQLYKMNCMNLTKSSSRKPRAFHYLSFQERLFYFLERYQLAVFVSVFLKTEVCKVQ